MKAMGTTTVITFGVCGGKETDVSYYSGELSSEMSMYLNTLILGPRRSYQRRQ